jgi:hypothetical protein
MSDELLQTEGRVLHDRASRGEALSETELASLDAYYVIMDAAEAAQLAPAFERMDREHVDLQEHLSELRTLVAREEQFLARLRELYRERQALNTERKRVLAH